MVIEALVCGKYIQNSLELILGVELKVDSNPI
jgi:hypothetical protein